MNPYTLRLQQLRKEWKEKPEKRAVIERVARALKEREKEYLELKKNVRQELT